MICVYPADCTDFSGNGLGAVMPPELHRYRNAERRVGAYAGA